MLVTGITGGIGGGLIALFGAYWKGKSELLGQIWTQFENIPFLMALKQATAYQEEAGRRAATHADLENVLRELQLVTEKTETIRTQIGTDAWRKQRVWEQKRDAYFTILKSCRTLRETLLRYVGLRRTNFIYAREHDYPKELADKQRGEEWTLGAKFLKQINEVNQEFDEAFLFLSDGVGLLFDEYTNEKANFLSLVSNEHYADGEEADQERIMDAVNFLNSWRGKLIDFAKVDLGVSSSVVLEFKKSSRSE